MCCGRAISSPTAPAASTRSGTMAKPKCARSGSTSTANEVSSSRPSKDGVQSSGCDRQLRDGARLLNRGVDRGGQRGTDGVDAGLTGTLDAQGIKGRRRVLAQQNLDLGHLMTGRHQIIGKARRQGLAVLVIDKLLQQRAADALRRRADDLALDQ